MTVGAIARKATTRDAAGMAATLAAAFDDDPIMTWLFGDAAPRRARFLRPFMAEELHRLLPHDEVYTVDGTQAAALWAPPGKWKTSPLQLLRLMPIMMRGVGRRLPAALRGLSRVEAAHARQPADHYYLGILGTDPEHQGRGLGSTVIQPVLDRCDADGIGAYLESSKEANIPFYRRHGFEVVEELTLPAGPSLWPMWRDPRPPQSRA